MKVVIGSDHAGYPMKENVKKYLEEKGVKVIDLGTNSDESVDYPLFGQKVGLEVTKNPYDFGVVICGTGIGISIAANKVKGVRAALVHDKETAKLAKEHNNANIIAFGGRNNTFENAKEMIDSFMEAKFEKRHEKRVNMLNEMESKSE